MGDLLEIKVAATTDPNKLAGSVCAAYAEGKEIVLCAIGPVPLANSYKAIVVVNRILAAQGVMFAIIPGMATRQIFDRETQKQIPWVVSVMRLHNIYGGPR